MIAIRMSQELETRLDRLAKRTGRTKTFYVREAIEQHIEDLEDLYLAEGELVKVRASAPTYSLDEVGRELGLES